MRTFITLGLSLLVGVSLADTIKVGAVTSLTGRFATFGKMQKAGFQVALDEINARGGVNGSRLELSLEDDASDTNKALSAAEKLVNEKVPVIIGAYSSGITKPLSQYLARVKVPLVVATAVDETITKPGNAYTFRVNNQSSVYSRSLADLFGKLNASKPGSIRTVAILTSNDAFGKSVQADAVNLLTRAGLTVLGKDTYDQGLSDFRPILNRYRAQNPDAVVIASYEQDAVAIARQIKEVGLTPKLVAGVATGFALPSFLEGAGSAAENMVVTAVWSSDVSYPGAQNLYARLKKELGEEPSQHAAQSYAAMLAVAEAIRLGGTTPETAQQALLKVKLSTPFGPVSFHNFGGYQNQNSVVGLITQIQNGKFVTVGPATAARGTLVFPKPK